MDSNKGGQPSLQKSMTRALFIESLIGNIKEKYFFEKKLGSGGYGAVYLAKNKITGKYQGNKAELFISVNNHLTSLQNVNPNKLLTFNSN